MNVFDSLIANQALALMLLGVGAAALAFLGAFLRQQERAEAPVASGAPGKTAPSHPTGKPGRFARASAFLIRHRVALLTSGGVFGVLGAAAFLTDWAPVPKTIGLSLPPIEGPVHTATPRRKLLIFIHGWNGDAQGTWRNLPQLARADSRLSDFDVWSIGYPTYITKRNIGISRLAAFFGDQFETVFGIYGRYDEIVIIAHSMGGLISRKILLQRQLANKSNRQHTILIEIATPHAGANQAKLLSALNISRGLPESMKPDSPYLRDLSDEWRLLPSRPSTVCIASEHDAVVPISSAFADCDKPLPYPDDYSHTAIVKPQTNSDKRYYTPIAHIPGVPPLPIMTPSGA